MVHDAFRPQRPSSGTQLRVPRLGALLLAALCCACQSRGEADASQRAPAASSPPAVRQAAPAPAPVVKPFRIVPRVRVSGFNPSESTAPKPAEPKPTKRKPAKSKPAEPVEATPEQQQKVEARLQSPWFLGELRRCYPTQAPVDTVIFLNIDRLGKVKRSTIEGVPAAFGPCVAELFNGLTIPELGSANEGNASDTLTVSGVLDVQTE